MTHDVIVADFGAIGSAAAYYPASRGEWVPGLERVSEEDSIRDPS